MKYTTNLTLVRVAILTAITLFSLLLIGISIQGLDPVSAQGCPQAAPSCLPPPTEPIHNSWPQSVTVTVYVDPAFTTDQYNDIKEAFENWNYNNGFTLNCSGVNFVGFNRQLLTTYPVNSLRIIQRVNEGAEHAILTYQWIVN